MMGSTMHDGDIHRFVEAQDPVHARVMSELRTGAKRSHWMWFVFPQIAGLGRSETARFYALGGPQAERDYLAHSVLGPRLRQSVNLMLRHAGRDPAAILGAIDAVKFRSSLTLFAGAAPEEPLSARRWRSSTTDPTRRRCG